MASFIHSVVKHERADLLVLYVGTIKASSVPAGLKSAKKAQ